MAPCETIPQAGAIRRKSLLASLMAMLQLLRASVGRVRLTASGARDRFTAWLRRRPLAADVMVAAVVLALSVPPITGPTGHNHALSLALILVMVSVLVWRRHAPFSVFIVITGVALVQLTTGTLNGGLALLVAFYTLTVYAPGRSILAGVAVLEGAALVTALSSDHALVTWTSLSCIVLATWITGYYVRTRRSYLASLVSRAERLERERDTQAQLGASAERARIAREMHDIIAHNIAVMTALADGATYTVAANPGQAAALMGEISATGRSALTEMHRLLGVLRQPAGPGQPGHAPQPTLAEIDNLLAAVRAAGLPTRLTVTGQPPALPPSMQLALYRIIQEALTNTLKHSTAASALVQLTYLPDGVELELTDDGQPRARPIGGTAAEPAAGHGITGMRERAAVFNGEVSAGPGPCGGWRVHTMLYLRPETT
jgi:signal transduction histidine kinase